MLNFPELSKQLSKDALAVLALTALTVVMTIVCSSIAPYQALAEETAPTGIDTTAAASTTDASTSTSPDHHNGQANTLPDLPSHLDLSSSEASLSAPITSPIELIIGGSAGTDGGISGGTAHLINPGEMLTAAQYTALHQVMTTGVQTLLLSASGTAVGGYASLTPDVVGGLSSLLIPQNVAINSIGFNQASPLSVSGAANILGSLYMLQTDVNMISVFNAGSLYIGPGGLLSGYLPANSPLPADVFASAGLSVNVVNNLVNQGTITSPGALSILAGGDIINQSINNIQAVISAQTLNLISGSGTFVNSGLLSAAEMLNIQTRDTLQNLLFDNQNGILESLTGIINFRDVLYSGKTDLLINGGDILASVLNLNGGEGKTTLAVNRLTALTNISAGEAYLTSDTDNVNLGNITLLGDPVFFNSSGSFTINGTITTNGGDLLILAATDILLGAGVGDSIINTTRTTGGPATSGHVWLIAGGVLGGVASGDTGMTPNLSAGPFTVTSAGALGGNIILSHGNNPASPSWSIDTRAESGSGQSGGNLTMIAFNGSNGGGRIEMGSNRGIATGGDGSGNNGNVLIIGGGNDTPGIPAEAIFLQNIDTTGGTGASGTITVYSANPITTNNTATGASIATVSFSQTTVSGILRLTPTNGFTPTGGTNLPELTANGSIRAGNLTSNGQLIRLFAGNNITAGTIDSSRTIGTAGAGNIILYAQDGNITGNQVLAQGASAGAGSSGGIIRIIAGQNISLNSVQSNGGGTGTSAGGQIDLIAGALSSITTAANSIRIDSGSTGSTNGGSITIGPGDTINAAGSGIGNGADITLIAFKGSVGTTDSGRINIAPSALITLSGASTGNNGNLLMVAADDTTGVNGISAGTINSSSGEGTAGTVRIGTTAIGFTGNVAYTTTTAARTNAFALNLTDNTSLRNSNITVGDITTNGGLIVLTSAQDITTGALTSSRSLGTGAGGSIALVSRSGTVSATSGNINSDGNNGGGGNILIWAGTNVEVLNLSARGIDSGSTSRTGGIIEIMAGLNMDLNANVFSSGTPTNTASGGSITINGTLLTSTGANAGSGGIITLAALGGSSGGLINGNSNLLIDASGGIDGAGGQIKLFAGSTASNTTSISVGDITNGTGSATSGSILIATTNTLATSPYTINASTATRGGTVNADLTDLSSLQNTNIFTGNLTTHGAAISLSAGGNINTANISTSRLSGTANGGNIAIISRTGDITTAGLSANGNAIVATGTTGNGGTISLWSGQHIILNGNISSQGGGLGNRSGGAVELLAGLNTTLAAGIFSSDGDSPASLSGGNIIASTPLTIDTRGINGGAGAAVTLAASSGSSGGNIEATNLTIDSSGGTSGAGGEIKLFAGSQATGTTSIALNSLSNSSGTGTSSVIRIVTSNFRALNTAGTVVTPLNLNATTAGRSGGIVTANLVDLTALQNTNVEINTISSNGGIITAAAGGNISINTINSSRINGTGSGGNISLVSSNGNISVTSDISSDGNDGNGGLISMWSGNNIQFAGISSKGIDSGATARTGGAVQIIAGLNMILNNNIFSSGASTGSVNGGSITTSGTLLTTTGANAGAGGAITLAAHGGSGGGNINNGNLQLDSSGGPTGTGGLIKIFAGSTLAGTDSITISNITNASGTGTSGTITIATANTLATSPYTLNSATAAVAGTINPDLTNSTALQNTNVSTGTITSHSGLISISAGGNINTANISTSRLSGTANGGNIAIISRTGNITTAGLSANGNAIVATGTAGNGGTISLWSGQHIILNGNISSQGGGLGNRSGGAVELLAGLNTTLAAGIFSSDGDSPASLSGGNIIASTPLTIDTRGINGGAGAAVTLAALSGSSGGNIEATNLTIDSSGGTSGAGGEIKLFAGSQATGTTSIALNSLSNSSGTGTSSAIRIVTSNFRALNTAGTVVTPLNLNATTAGRSGGIVTANLVDLTALQNTNVEINTISSNGGIITAAAGSNISINTINSSRINGTGNGGNISLVSSNGNISITSDISSDGNDGNGGLISMWSGNNIQFAGISSKGIDAATTTRTGGAVQIIAGLNMILNNNIFSSGATTGSVNGGSITTSGTLLTTTGANAGAGGAITLAAHGGTGGGNINSGNLQLDSSGGATGIGGLIKIFAGSTLAGIDSITLGNITNASGTGTSNAITVATANTLATSPYTLNSATAAVAGTINPDLTDSTTLQNTNVSTGTITSHGGLISISAGGNINTANISTSRLSGTANGGNIAIISRTGNITTAGLSANGNAIVATGTTGNGGTISLWSGQHIILNGNISSQGGGLGNRSGGAVELLAGLNTTLAAGIFSSDGDSPASLSGGNIIASTPLTVDTRGINGGAGAAVTLAALSGSSGGNIEATNLTIDSSGGTSSAGGEIKLFAGSQATGTTSIALNSLSNSSGTGTSSAIRIVTSNFRALNTAGTVVTPLNLNATTAGRSGGIVTANLVDLAALQNTNVEINTISSNGGIITAAADGNISINTINSSRINGTGNGGNISLVSSNGNISITSDISSDGNNGNGGNISMWSGNNVEFAGISARGIDAATATRTGGSVQIIAGLNMILNNNIFSSGATTGSVNGGSITTSGTQLTTTGANAGAGGAITLAAHGGTSGGTINSANLQLDSSGGATGIGGLIKVFAGSTFAGTDSITIGNITNASGTGTSNAITIATTNTLASSPYTLNAITAAPTGTINPDLTDSAALQNTNVSTGTITTHGGLISISAGGNINTANISTSRLSGTANGGNIAIISRTGNITTAGLSASGNAVATSGTANGGAISVWAGQNITIGNVSSLGLGLGARNGGSIDIYAGVETNLASGVVSTAGSSPASGTGGKIVFVSGTSQLQSLGINGGNGSRITLAAFGGSNLDSGTILGMDAGTTPSILTSGGATGAGGAISIFAGNTDAGSLAVRLNNLTTSGGTAAGSGSAGIITVVTSNALTNGIDNTVALSTGTRNAAVLVANLTDLATLQDTSIQLGNVSTNGNLIQMAAGGDLSTGSITSRVAGTGTAANIALVSETGNINIAGDITANGLNGNGGRVFVWAGKDISFNNISTQGTDSGSTARNGGSIELLAGINLELSNNIFTTAGDPPGSASGGNINIASSTLISSTGANAGAGGAITFAALAGAGGGNINGNSSLLIDASGGTTGAGGAIRLFAGSTDNGTTAITTGNITNGLGTGTSDSIQIATSNARALDATSTVFTPATLTLAPATVTRAGGIISANLISDSDIQNTAIFTGNITTHGGAVMIATGEEITAANIDTSRLAGTASGGNISLYSKASNINIGNLTANGNATATTGTANGGTISVWSGGNINVGNISSQGTGTGNRSGGVVDLYAGVATSLSDGILTTDGVSPSGISGGSIIFNDGTSLITTTGIGSGAGGRVTLAAFGGSTAGSGTVAGANAATLPDITTGSAGSGANGNILIFAGNTTAGAQSVNLGNMDTTGSTGAAGAIIIASSNALTSGGDNALTLTTGARNTNTLIANLTDLTALQDTNIKVGNLSTNGQNASQQAVQITSAGNITTGNITTSRIDGNAGGGSVVLTSILNSISAGSITANANGSGAGGTITLLAGANVEAISLTSEAAGATGAGGSITVIAGANLEMPAAGQISIPDTGSASASGGSINLSGSGTTIASRSTSTAQIINVMLVAYDGSDLNSGRIAVAGDISTQALTGGQNGNVIIIGGETENGATAISTGAINTSGAGTGNGTIYLAGATPELASPLTVAINAGGAASTTFFSTLNTVQDTVISTQALTTNGAAITILAGQEFTTNNNDISTARTTGNGTGGAVSITSQYGAINIGSNNDILAGGNNGGSGAIFLQTAGAITARDIISSTTGTGNAGAISVEGGVLALRNVYATGGTTGGAGATIFLSSGTTILVNEISASGSAAAGNAGNIIVASQSLLTVNDGISADGGNTGNGGNISLLSGSDIVLNGFSVSATGGANGGNAGSILAVAGTELTNNAGTISLSGASSTGGSIISTLLLGFDASAQGGNGQGGDITFIAYNEATGSGSGGQIKLEDFNAVMSSGNNTGASGNILMIAEDKDAAGAETLVSGALFTSCCGGVGGNVSLATAEILSSGAMEVDKSSGQLSGTFSANQNAVLDGSISTQVIITDAGDITVLAGANINTNGADLITDAFITDNTGGNISLTAGGAISTGNLSAQGSGSGNGGNISVKAAAGSINVLSIVADASGSGNGGTILVDQESANLLQVTGDISANSTAGGQGGQITLKYNDSLNPLDIGSVAANSFVSGFIQANSTGGNGGSIIIANNASGPTANLAITGATGILDAGGSTNGSIIFNSPDSNVDINLAQITGAVTGSAATGFSVTTAAADLAIQNITTQDGNIFINAGGGNLNSTGALNADNGLISLNAANDLMNSASITADGLAMNAGGALTMGAGILAASQGSIDMVAGTVLTIADGSSLTAYTDVNLNANNGITIGQNGGTGITVNAGLHQPGSDIPYEVIDRNTAISNGAVNIISLGAGDIYLGDNVQLVSHGGAGNSTAAAGSIGLFSGRSINADTATLTAWGGNIWLNATVDITLNGTGLFAVAKLDDSGATATSTSGATFPAYTGGGIALLAGVPAADAQDILAAQVNQRPPANQNIIDIDPSLAFNQASPNFSIGNSSILRIIMSSLLPQAKNVDPDLGNIYNISGGVIFMDPPGNPTITLTNATLTAIGPAVPPLPPAPPSAGGVNTLVSVTAALPNLAPQQAPLITLPVVAINLGVPTDRIFYQITLGQESTHKTTLAYRTRGAWVTAAGNCDPITIEGQPGAFIIGQQGTMVTLLEENALAMKSGRLVLISGAKPITMDTSLGVVQSPANGMIVIDNSQNNSLTVTNLSTSAAHVYAVCGNAVKEIKMNPGEEVSVKDNTKEGEAALKTTGGQNTRENLSFGTRCINSADMLAGDELFACTTRLNVNSRQRFDTLKAALVTHTPANTSSQHTGEKLPGAAGTDQNNPDSTHPAMQQSQPGNLQPIAYASPAAGATTQRIRDFENDFLTIKYPSNAELITDSKTASLQAGEALLICRRQGSFRLGKHMLELRPGTIALVSVQGTVTKVRNLWEERHGSIKEFVGPNFITIGAGQELITADNDSDLNKTISADQLGRRQILRATTISKHAVATSEYSILSLVLQSGVLQDLTSRRASNDANVLDKIMKMAACLQIVTAKHGSYSNTNGR